MKLIAVISHKGGAGKTTSAVQLAEELARRGQRTLLVDADRQQGAGLLLGIDTPAGCVQRTMVSDLDYLGSARLTDLEVADCYASVADRFDIGIVDTPSLDDPLARAWLREAAATLMVLQVDPLTVKTLPSALNTLEVVRAFKPTIQLLGLLPTMFNQEEATHRSLLAELLSRRPEAVFTPVVPADPGLMHRANPEECPPVSEAAQQAYQCAVDRILRSLETASPSVGLPRAARPAAGGAPAAERPAPPWAQAPGPGAGPNPPAQGYHQAPHAEPTRQPAAAAQAAIEAPAAPAAPWHQPQPAAAAGPAPRRAAPPPPEPGWEQAPPSSAPAPALADDGPAYWQQAPDEQGQPDAALETLAAPRTEAPAPRSPERDPDWWRKQAARVDDAGVVRRVEPWLVRARFAIACTVACLALIAAIVMGTLMRAPAGQNGRMATGKSIPAAHAEPNERPSSKGPSAGKAPSKRRRAESSSSRSSSKGERKP